MVKEIERAGIPVVHICIRSEEDRRVVYIRLTEKGIKAYHHHEEFHKKMTDAVVEALDQEEEKKLRRGIVEKALEALTTEVDGQKVFE